jgi:flagellin
MPAVLNTNMASLYAQKNLATAQADLAGSVQKLSSGMRINSAKDDAAGYAVAEAVKATKNVTDQSIQNSQDAISMVQTAEGAMDVVSKMLQRVLTLVTQKDNGSLTGTATTGQKGSINSEISTLLNEVNQIRSRTKFQGGQSSIFGTTSTFATGDGVSSSVTINSLTLVDLGLGLNGAAATFASVATNAITTAAAHGFAVGDAILYKGTGATTSLTTGQTYYVKTAGTTTTMTLAATSGGAELTITAAPGTFTKVNDTTQTTVDALTTATVMTAVQNNIANRASLGAQQNRLDYIVDNMQTLSNNLADAMSRIVDTNYAAETANLTRGQILQQAATSMLAQANQMPNVILTLLK